MIKNKLVPHLAVSSVSLAVLLLFITNVDPADKPLPYILVPIILFWIFVYALLNLLVLLLSESTKLKRIIIFATTSAIVFMLTISGVGGLSLWDITLVITLVFIMTFYFYRTWG